MLATLLATPFDRAAQPFYARVHDRLRAVAGGAVPVVTAVDRATAALAAETPLADADAAAAFQEVIAGGVPEEQVGAFLLLLRPERLAPATIAAFARVVREVGVHVTPRLAPDDVLLDTCGTGSDGAGTFNVSTTTMFVLAAAGIRIAKHGNRAITSRCGSADVLEALGVRTELPPDAVARCIETAGIGFMLAPAFHPALAGVQRIRRALTAEVPAALHARTVFNVLGPLANPAGARRQLVGVYAAELTGKVAHVLALLGAERALVVFGGGLDELTTTGETVVAELRHGRVSERRVTPEEAGLARVADMRGFAGGDAAENARLLEAILAGEPGPRADLVALNAAAGLVLADRAATLRDGVAAARALLANGAAARKLDELRRATRLV